MNARLKPDSFYVYGQPVPASFFQAIDTAQYKAINARNGGTWAPASALVVGGAGVWAQGLFTYPDTGAITTPAASGARITHGDSDWVVLSSGNTAATRTLRTTLGDAADASCAPDGNSPNGVPRRYYDGGGQASQAAGIPNDPSDNGALWTSGAAVTVGTKTRPTVANGFYFTVSNAGSGTIGAVEPAWPTSLGTSTTADSNGVIWTCTGWTYRGGMRLVRELEVHHGALLQASLVFNFIVADAHAAGLPARQPLFRVFKLSTAGVLTPLATNAALPGWAGHGYIQLTASSAAAYYNAGAAQQLAYTLDVGDVIDLTRYTYYAEVIDEAGIGAVPGNRYLDVAADFTSIPDLGPQ